MRAAQRRSIKATIRHLVVEPLETRFMLRSRTSLRTMALRFEKLESRYVLNHGSPPPFGLELENPWPMLGHDASRSGQTLLVGPDDATVIPPWPFFADAPVRSSPVVDKQGVAYFGTDAGTLFAAGPTAVDTEGLERWRFSASANGTDRILGAPALKEPIEGSPQRVYFATESGEVFALNTQGGAEIWHVSLGVTVNSSPAVTMEPGTGLVDVYIRAADGVYHLEESGTPSMPTVTSRRLFGISVVPNNATSVALSPDAKHVYATDGLRAVYFQDAATGAEICPRVTLLGSGSLTTPVVDADGNIYYGARDGNLYRFPPTPTGPGGTCQPDWVQSTGGPIESTPAVAPDDLLVFFTAATLQTAERATGSLTCADCWSFPAQWVHPGLSALAVDGSGVVYVNGRDARVHAIRGDGGGTALEVWSVLADGFGTLTAPALDSDGRLFVGGTDERLYVFQEAPAFKVAFQSTYTDPAAQPDAWTLREVYGRTDPLRTIPLTRNPAFDGEPTYSSDGRWMAYVSDRDGTHDIFLATAGGGQPRNLSRVTPPPPSCNPVVTGDRTGLNGTTHAAALDGSQTSFFESSFHDWQYIQVDFNCVGQFNGLRRYMTTDGVTTTGNRVFQGEGASYSLDGTTWTSFTGATTSGWESYINYAPTAWRNVNYGWSSWLMLDAPVQARYVRFQWDDDFDAVNEVAIDFDEPPPDPPPFPLGSDDFEPAFSPFGPEGRSPLFDHRHYLATTVLSDQRKLYFIDLEELAAGDVVETVMLPEWLGRQFPGGSAIDSSSQQAHAAFSSDGSLFAYSACQQSPTGFTHDLALVDLEGTHDPVLGLTPRSVLVSQPAIGGCQLDTAGFAPAFSPDSRYLVYQFRGDLALFDVSAQSIIATLRSSQVRATHPHWSPDGTEIVFTGTHRTTGRVGLFVAQGPRYRFLPSLTAALGPPLTAVFDEAEYHPRRFPEPLLTNDCVIGNPNAIVITPASARPGEPVEIRGCGFDIREPNRNHVYFAHARFPARSVEAGISGARVDVDTGLGVLTVTVPHLAGDGPVRIATAFGAADTGAVAGDCRDGASGNDIGCFHVLPEPVALVQPATVVGAQIRVLGYGFQIHDTYDPANPPPQRNHVFFSGASGNSAWIEATVTRTVLGSCNKIPAGFCPSGAPLEDGERKTEWLEVFVPAGIGQTSEVRVGMTSDPNDASAVLCANQVGTPCPFALLQPKIELSIEDGSEGLGGMPGEPLGPTTFDMIGSDFPYDPYFSYTLVDLTQISSDGLARAVLGADTLTPDAVQRHVGGFTATNLAVQPDSTGQGGELTMEAVGFRSGAIAQTQLRTPLRNLPIIFIPGTSGTFITNNGPEIVDAPCLLRPPLTYEAEQNIWMSERTVLHTAELTLAGINLGGYGCFEYLGNAIALAANNNGPMFPQFASVRPGRVIDRVDFPHLPDPPVEDVIMYQRFADFVLSQRDYAPGGPRASLGLGRGLGVPATGACPSGNNCYYEFNLDWRMDYESQANLLKKLIDRVINSTGLPKVVVVTHSVGSMVAQYYLRANDGFQKVDQVVSLGGGYLGVPLPYKILQVGDDWGANKQLLGTGIEVFDPDGIQGLAQNWPTAYWQSPSLDYLIDPNGACDDGDCSVVWEDNWDLDGDGRCGSEFGGATHPCDSRYAPSEFVGKHRSPSRTIQFMRNAPHDDCSTCVDGDRSHDGVQVNQVKFDHARTRLFVNPLDITIDCEAPNGQPRRAGIGDWRCGTEGVFFHRVVGYGAETVGRMHFYQQSICSRPSVASGIVTGIALSVSILGLFGCLIEEDIREPVMIDGDHTVPLRSTVGILEGFDDRVWGVDWRIANRNQPGELGYNDDDALFHQRLSWDTNIQSLMGMLFGGRVSNLSQLPVIVDGSPYFKLAQGNAAPRFGTTQWQAVCSVGGLCSAPSSPAPAPPAPGTLPVADYWRVRMLGHASLHVTDASGRHTGPLDAVSGRIDSNIPSLGYDRGPNYTHATLLGDEQFVLRLAPGDVEHDVVNLRLEAVVGRETIAAVNYMGVPIGPHTTGKLSWDPTAGQAIPQLELDYAGDGNAVLVVADVLSAAEASDLRRPEATMEVVDDRLKITADDFGGSGVATIYYGFDREQNIPYEYTEGVDLPPGTRYVWAYAVDRAGNAQYPPTTFDTCDDCAVDLFVAVDADANPVKAGDPLTYTVRVKNVGSEPAANVRIVSELPTAVSFQSVTVNIGECGAVFGTLLCEIDRISALADVVATVVVTVDPSATGLLVHVARVLTGDPDSNPQDNTATVTTSIFDDTPPVVVDVAVGAGPLGMTRDVLPAPTKPLAWATMNRIDIIFSEDVTVSASDLAVRGSPDVGNDYAFAGFVYDSDSYTARWFLDRDVPADRLLFVLSDRVADRADNLLDGDRSGSDGGNFVLRLDVLPGDVDASGVVDRADIRTSMSSQFSQFLDARYDVVSDVNADGIMSILDAALVRDGLGTTLPSRAPSSPSPAAPSPVITALSAVVDDAGPSDRPAARSRPSSVLSAVREPRQRQQAAAVDRIFADTCTDVADPSATRRVLRASRQPARWEGPEGRHAIAPSVRAGTRTVIDRP